MTATPVPSVEGADPSDVRLATRAPATLAPFNAAGVLLPADVHAATTLCRLASETDPGVLLAAALAVRAPRHGHVCVDLRTVAATVTGLDDATVDLRDLRWPPEADWMTALSRSPVVAVRPPGVTTRPTDHRPLVLVDHLLYLDRFWRYERRVAEILRRRAARDVDGLDPATVRACVGRLLPTDRSAAPVDGPDQQRLAAATAALRYLTVIAGGPGTGKTHTTARVLALLLELAGDRRLRVAVAAPTGKAADRLTAALRSAAGDLDTPPAVQERLGALEATTLHRLLGRHPAGRTRFRHDRSHKLPHDVVVVDETSMVSLALMAKLLEALRPSCRLVLVGDPDQLESVEAGAVLGDVVGPAGTDTRRSPAARMALQAASGEPVGATERDAGGVHDSVVVLRAARRFGAASGIATLAAAIHAGDTDEALRRLADSGGDVSWIAEPGDAVDGLAHLHDVRDEVRRVGAQVHAAALRGDGEAALSALGQLRILCGHRRGAVGVSGWVSLCERWLTATVPGYADREWYVGRPVLITRNQPRLGLSNGDVGAVVRADDGGVDVAFENGRRLGPGRLEDAETVHALTIHKSQGSQYGHVVVVLPDERSPVLTRELLYTAVTRAERRVTVVGTEESIRTAVARRVARASGLREALWGA